MTQWRIDYAKKRFIRTDTIDFASKQGEVLLTALVKARAIDLYRMKAIDSDTDSALSWEYEVQSELCDSHVLDRTHNYYYVIE